ncbi:MAG: CRISPR-associated endoribonuclease Cas6, partial [Thermostichales cyanobacterium SRBZ-1_bins_19]
ASQTMFPQGSQVVGVALHLKASQSYGLDPHYAKGLHAWFLDQVRQTNPSLSRLLHDGDPQAFTISRLLGPLREQGSQLLLPAQQPCRWLITVLQPEPVEWLQAWLRALPPLLELRRSPLQITGWDVALPPTTYAHLADPQAPHPPLSLTFLSPTSFRHRGHHLPLPIPRNLFQSYLRRWNAFSGIPIPEESFLDQVDEGVIVQRLKIESHKTTAGKQGSVTGFVGAIQLGLSPRLPAEVRQHIYSLLRFAPYSGTGHKTTFGLGQTRLGWQETQDPQPTAIEDRLGERIQELTQIFSEQRKRQGGSRTERVASLWATILARRENHESLQTIAADLQIPYETAKTYAKLARRALQNQVTELTQ